MADKLPDVRVVVLRMMNVPNIDQTGLYALEEVVLGMHKRNIAVVITGLQNQPYRMLQRINLIPGLIPESYLFDKVEDCIQWLGEELRQTTGSDQAFFEKLNEVRNENKASFIQPDRIKIEFLIYSVAGLVPSIKITDQEIQDYFEFNKYQFDGQQQRKARHILFSFNAGITNESFN